MIIFLFGFIPLVTPLLRFFSGGFSSIMSAGGDLLGAGINAYANHREAALNREFQERMAKNQLQYRVEDAKAAGINPVYAVANMNTSVPSGSQAAPLNASFSNTAKSLMELEKRNAEKTSEVADATIDKINSETNLNNANAAKIGAETTQIPTLSPLEVNRLARGKNQGEVGKIVNDTISTVTYLFDGAEKVNKSIRDSTEAMIRAKLETSQSAHGNNAQSLYSEEQIKEMTDAALEKVREASEFIRRKNHGLTGLRVFGP